MKAYGLALGLALLLTGCATSTSGVALYGPAGGAPTLEQHQNVNVTLTELSRRQQNGLLQVNVAAASTQRGDNKLQYIFYWYDEAGQEVASDGRGWTPSSCMAIRPAPSRPWRPARRRRVTGFTYAK